MPRDYQASFTGGEIAPGLYARADLTRYQTSLALLKNWFIHAQGGISTRAGLKFVYQHPDNKLMREVPFQFNTEQTYMLLFSDLEMRVIKDGGVVLEDALVINDVTAAGVITTTAPHGYSNGDEVFISGTGTDLDNRFFTITGASGSVFTTTTTDTTSSTGAAGKTYILTTTYVEADLFQLNYTQSADVMTITNPYYVPAELTRTDHNAWTLTNITFATDLTPPVNLTSSTVGSGHSTSVGDRYYRYVVTSNDQAGDESIASEEKQHYASKPLTSGRGIELSWDGVVEADYYNVYKEMAYNSGTFGFIGEADARGDNSIAISAITNANPPVVTTASAHGLTNNESIWIENIVGETEFEGLNDRFHAVSSASGSVFTLADEDASTATGPHGTPGDIRFKPGFNDYNLGADESITPPIQYNPFASVNTYPICVTYYQQRLVFGGSTDFPQTMWFTKTSDYDNMDYSRPRQADDSIEVTLANQQVNQIRHMVSMDKLMVLTSGGEWAAQSADDSDVLKPGNIRMVREGGRGTSTVRPVEIGGDVLFMQQQGSRVRSLSYSFEADKHTTSDLSVMAQHLFEGYQIVDWCFAEEPYSMIWAVRDDGGLLSLTYLREQEVWGWAQHETDGTFVSVGAIEEGNEDIVYATVKRTINGTDRYFVERMNERAFTSMRDSFCVDAGLTYTSPTAPAITNTSVGLVCTVTAPGHGLSDGDVIWIRNVVGMTELNDRQYVVSGAATNTFVPQDFEARDIDSRAYKPYVSGGVAELCTTTITNLHHLEGETLVALADGVVVDDLLVSSGTVTLPQPAYMVHIGIGYNCDFQTLPLDLKQEITTQSRKKAIPRVGLRVEDTRGLQGGQNENKLYDFKERDPAMSYGTIDASVGMKYLDLAVPWSDDAQVYIRQPYPLPAKVLAIVPEVEVI